MVHAQSVAKDPAQPIGKLGGEKEKKQKIEHLLALVQSTLNELDIYFGLAAARDTVKEHSSVALPLPQHLLHGFFLCRAQGMTQYCCMTDIMGKASLRHVVGFQHTLLQKSITHGHRFAALMQELRLGHLLQ